MASSLAAGAVRHLPRWPRAPRVTAEDRRDARLLMETVYGRWRALPPGARFVPRPLPAGEAAEAPGGQRRYLWTDAFAVLNLVTDAARCGDEGDEGGARPLEAALALVETTTRTLGSPRAPDLPMAPSEYPLFTLDPVVPQTPHRANGRKPRWRGLRIGKRLAAKSSDPGMALDGQYFHYVDKWLVALARLASELPEDDPRRVRVATEAVHVVKDVHPHFIEREPFINGPSIDAFSADRDARQETRVGAPIGVRWKINADASPVVGLPRARPSSDAVSGSIAYGLVDRAARAAGVRVPIEHERGEMRRIARALSPGVSLDALGWGLQAWEAQWLARDDRDADADGAASGAEADGRWAEFARDVRSRRSTASSRRPRANGPAVPSVARAGRAGFGRGRHRRRRRRTRARPARAPSYAKRRRGSFRRRQRRRVGALALLRRPHRDQPRHAASALDPRVHAARGRPTFDRAAR